MAECRDCGEPVHLGSCGSRPKKRVVIESPLKGDYVANRRYALACIRDSLSRGEAPYASHIHFDQIGVLDDRDEAQRNLGMEAGFAWGGAAELAAVYTDRGISEGMRKGIACHEAAGIPVEYRDGVAVPEETNDGGREIAMEALRAAPPGSRMLLVIALPNGLLQTVFEAFAVWEFQGIVANLLVRGEVFAANQPFGPPEEPEARADGEGAIDPAGEGFKM